MIQSPVIYPKQMISNNLTQIVKPIQPPINYPTQPSINYPAQPYTLMYWIEEEFNQDTINDS
jgi:hypothetical protein